MALEAMILARAADELGEKRTAVQEIITSVQQDRDLADPQRARAMQDLQDVAVVEAAFERDLQAGVSQAMQDASKGELKGILDYNTAPLVSVDFNHNPASCTFDATQTAVVDGAMARVMGWYDNEMGYVHTLVEHVAAVGRVLEGKPAKNWYEPAISTTAIPGPTTTWR